MTLVQKRENIRNVDHAIKTGLPYPAALQSWNEGSE